MSLAVESFPTQCLSDDPLSQVSACERTYCVLRNSPRPSSCPDKIYCSPSSLAQCHINWWLMDRCSSAECLSTWDKDRNGKPGFRGMMAVLQSDFMSVEAGN